MNWTQLTANDAPTDALRMVLGLEANAPNAMEETMSETAAATENVATKEKTMATTTKGTKPKSTSKARATKATKATPKKTVAKPKPKKERPPKGPNPARVFAIRVTDEELAAIHRASGPRNATRFIRAVAAAFAKGDESAFRAVVQEARTATKA